MTLVCLWTGAATAQPVPVQDPAPDELARLREENQRLRAELERQRALSGPPGIIQWRTEGLMDVTGVDSREIHSDLRLARGVGLTTRQAFSYRAQERAAVELLLHNTGAEAWWVDRALLVGAGGHELEVLSVWMKGPIGPGQMGRVLVEVRGEPPLGTYSLRLWREAETPDLLLENVRFPEAGRPHPGGRP